MLIKILSRIIINAIAIYAAVRLVDGIDLEINFYNLVLAGLLLGVINTFLKPILTILSLPFVLLTFGLFTIIINIGLLFLMAYLIPSFEVASFWSGLLGVLIISLVNYLLSKITKWIRKFQSFRLGKRERDGQIKSKCQMTENLDSRLRGNDKGVNYFNFKF